MKATEDLKQEHKGIKLMLNILGKINSDTIAGKALNVGHFESILEFLQVFVDRCHHGKEEDILFPAIEGTGITRENGPIGVLLTEHRQGRAYVKAMREAFNCHKNGDKKSAADTSEIAGNYINLLIRHIDKENNIIYPLADSRLSKERQTAMPKEFEKIEIERIGAGKHEEFHRLLHNLKQIYLAD